MLGLAYKPLTHIVEESQSILLAKALSDIGLRVIGYDPLAAAEAAPVLQYHTLVEEDLTNTLKEATVVVVANDDDTFRNLTPEQILLDKERVVVVDVWRCLNADFANKARYPRIDYIPIGKHLGFGDGAEKLKRLWGAQHK